MTALPLPAEVSRRPFTVQEYERLGQVGILGEDDRVELIRGEIIQMTPIGSVHASRVNCISRLFFRRLGDRVYLSSQNPIVLDSQSEPQPDIVLARPRVDEYVKGHPTPDCIHLVIEVADTSVGYDLLVKAPLYAAAGIPELWVVDLPGQAVVVHRDPGPTGYASIQRRLQGDELSPRAFPDCVISVDELLR